MSIFPRPGTAAATTAPPADVAHNESPDTLATELPDQQAPALMRAQDYPIVQRAAADASALATADNELSAQLRDLQRAASAAQPPDDPIATGLRAARESAPPPTIYAEMGAVQKRLDEVRTAHRHAARAHETAVRMVSREHCATRRAELAAIGRRKLAAILAIGAAHRDELALHKDIQRRGFDSGSLPALGALSEIGDPYDASGSPAHYARKELERIVELLERE